jgi:hypothetical protein
MKKGRGPPPLSQEGSKHSNTQKPTWMLARSWNPVLMSAASTLGVERLRGLRR